MQNDSPHILCFSFNKAIVYIGDGYQNTFGDGDDTIICFDETAISDLDKFNILSREPEQISGW